MKRLLKNSGKQVGPIYHFTTVENLLKILYDDSLKGHNDRFGIGISFTRDKNLWFNGAIRIHVDGDSLSNRYHIEPFNFFKDDRRKDYNGRGESEERVWESEINPIKPYITEITIYKERVPWHRSYIAQQILKNENYKVDDIVQFIQNTHGITVSII